MCGLVGILAADMTHKHFTALKFMLYFNQVRGVDATGVAAVRMNGDMDVFKTTVPSSEFIQDPRLDQLTRYVDKAWIGHCRAGTIGKNTRSNAHPFIVYDDDGDSVLVGAHNGTLKNKANLDRSQYFGTDSEAMFNMLYHKGPKAAVAEFDGAWALTWYDPALKALQFLRNKERTLFFAYDKDEKTMLWASEEWMITVAAEKAGITLGKDIFYFEEDVLYNFPLPKGLSDKITFTVERGVVGKPATPFFQGAWTGGQTTYEKREENPPGTSTDQSKSRKAITGPRTPHLGTALHVIENSTRAGTSAGTGASNSKTGRTQLMQSSSMPGMKKGFNGKLLDRKSFLDIIAFGCSWCETEEIGESDIFGWMDSDTVVCNKCLKDTHDSVLDLCEEDAVLHYRWIEGKQVAVN